MNLQAVVTLFVALFGTGAASGVIKWASDRHKNQISIEDARIAQAASVTKTALETLTVLREEVNNLNSELHEVRAYCQRLEKQNTDMRSRINHLEHSLAAWKQAWQQRHPDEPFPVQ